MSRPCPAAAPAPCPVPVVSPSFSTNSPRLCKVPRGPPSCQRAGKPRIGWAFCCIQGHVLHAARLRHFTDAACRPARTEPGHMTSYRKPEPRHSALRPDVVSNLASAGLGARAIWASNQFFAPLDRMLQDHDPRLHRGASSTTMASGWMAGRRSAAATVAMTARSSSSPGRGRIIGFDIDTTHFTGNYAPAVRIEACSFAGDEPPADQTWVEILRHKPLGPSAHHYRFLPELRELVASASQYLSRRRHRAAQGLTACRNSTRPMRRARSTSPPR